MAESDESENEDENDEIPAIIDNLDESEVDEEDKDNNYDLVESILTEIPTDESRSSSRFASSSSSTSSRMMNTEGTEVTYVPEFKGYKGRNEFEGVNKRAIQDQNCHSVLSFFQLFVTLSIMKAFVAATNYWGRTYHQRYWKKDIDVAEFKAFLAIVFEMGVNKYSNREVAFQNSDHSSTFIKSLMTKTRFNEIMMCWRYEDYSKTTSAMRTQQKLTSPFWRAKGFITLVATAFDHFFNPGQMLDIDEQCIPWKGRHKCIIIQISPRSGISKSFR